MSDYIIPIIAFFTFIGGVVCMVLPFLPFGWFLIFVTVLLLLPYIKAFEKGYRWVAGRDRTGISQRAGRMTSRFYRWVGDRKNADRIETVAEECERERVEKKKKRKAKRAS